MTDDEFLNDRDCAAKSPTPRTDAAVRRIELPEELPMFLFYVSVDFARDLERELARALRVVEAARALDGHSDTALALSIAIEEWEDGR